jgi:hypothetical protein
MKKQLLLFTSVIAVFTASAQITITDADIATVGKTILQKNDTMPTVSIGNSGASQTWNLAALNSHTTDTMYFVNPAGLPNASQFPSSNLGIKMRQQGQNTNVFANISSANLRALGIGATVDIMGTPYNVVLKNNPAEIISNFPATYNTTFNNNYVTKGSFYFGIDPGIGFTVDSVRLVSHVNKTVTFDGWGSVTTPMGTYNSLRVETLKHNSDTISGYIAMFGMWIDFQTTMDSSKTYDWWANGIGFNLASVTVDWVTENAISATWLPSLPTVGINEYTSAESVNVFPNPAQNVVNFMVDASKAQSIQVYDITGKMINAYTVSVNNPQIDITSFANGIYSYSVVGKNGVVLNRGKFTVAK